MSGDRKGKLSRVHCICTIHCVQYTVEKQCTANHVIIMYLPLCLYREHLNVQYDILFMPDSFQRNDLCFAQSIMLGHFPCLWGCTDDCNTDVCTGSGFFNANAWGIPLWYWKSSHNDCWLQKALNLLWWFPDLRHGCSLEWWHFTCSVCNDPRVVGAPERVVTLMESMPIEWGVWSADAQASSGRTQQIQLLHLLVLFTNYTQELSIHEIHRTPRSDTLNYRKDTQCGAILRY